MPRDPDAIRQDFWATIFGGGRYEIRDNGDGTYEHVWTFDGAPPTPEQSAAAEQRLEDLATEAEEWVVDED